MGSIFGEWAFQCVVITMMQRKYIANINWKSKTTIIGQQSESEVFIGQTKLNC